MDDQDWRLNGQERYLTGARLRHAQYRAPSAQWDHDHCSFCSLKLSEHPDADGADAGWQTEDAYHWVCDGCFVDFRERFGFVEIDGP